MAFKKKLDLKNLDIKKAAKDFWYGKPHGERRLGDLYEDKTGLYKHREWRGVKDTMYYFYNVWLYNYIHMVMDVQKFGGVVNFAKECPWGFQVGLVNIIMENVIPVLPIVNASF